MRRVILWSAATMVLPLCVGCGQNSQIVRGQAPVEEAQLAPPQYGQMSNSAALDPNCPPGFDVAGGGGGNPYLPPAYRHGIHCFPPVSTNVYPQEAPPAVVQYPYYTTKGPDCFFLK